MNLENLDIGDTIKNYKELCKILKEPILEGNSKRKQLKEWGLCFEYHKNGQSFIIDKVYSQKQFEIKSARTEYIRFIEALFLDSLSSYKNNKIQISTNKLLKMFKMINNNFLQYIKRQKLLSETISINEDTIEEYYKLTKAMLKRNIESALNELQKAALITWRFETWACEITEDKHKDFDVEKHVVLDEDGEQTIDQYKITRDIKYIHRPVTESEEIYITHLKNEYYKGHGLMFKDSPEQEIVKKGLWENYKNYINKCTLNKFHIAYNYNVYKILFTKFDVQNGYCLFLKNLLNTKNRIQAFTLLNDNIVKKLIANAENRMKFAEEELASTKTITEKRRKTDERRTSDTYLSDNQKLTNFLVSYKKFEQ